MCVSCHPLKKYESIHSKHEMDLAKKHAALYVEEGNLEIVKEMEEDDYYEIEYYCNACGTKHVLWLHTCYLEHGGEWRALPSFC